MHPVVWWIATAVVFFILELTTASFFFLWIGAGAVLTAILSLLVDTAWIEYLFFALSSLLLIVISRRWAHVLSGKAGRPSNVDALIGQMGIVTKVHPETSWQGWVKVNGEAWKAEAVSQHPLTKGSQVTVQEAHSNVLIVKNSE